MTFPSVASPIYVYADYTRLKQVMINLIANAIKYNRVGGAVTVQCLMNGENRVRVSIKDTGAGLSPTQMAQLFQPFNRLGKESGSIEGTGIGLVVTKRLVTMMGGIIGVESGAGVGTEFWVELGVASAPAATISGFDGIAATQQGRQGEPNLSPQRTLLYVEDNPANLLLVEQLIAQRSDLRMLTAVDAYLGIQMARVHHPDVILMDIHLPGLSGFGALKILREDPKTAHIPVLAISANAIAQDVAKGMEAGFFRYVTKPIKIDEFMKALDVALLYAAEKCLPGKDTVA